MSFTLNNGMVIVAKTISESPWSYNIVCFYEIKCFYFYYSSVWIYYFVFLPVIIFMFLCPNEI